MIKEKIKNCILYIWQLPQNIIGLIFSKIVNKTNKSYLYQFQDIDITITNSIKGGVSLGKYIIVGINCNNYNIISHEYGHYLQSKILGPMYILIVGIPSIIHNIYYSTFNKEYDYYSVYPEKWANNLSSKYITKKILKLNNKLK